MVTDVLVIGAGAAGIFAATRTAELGARTVLLEKTPRIGTKILVSGGGKCNVAHDGPLDDVLRAFTREEAAFLRPAAHRMPNDAIIRLFTGAGLEVYTRDDGRVFPVHQTAKDVVAILRRRLDEAGVDIRLESPVTELLIEDGEAVGVRAGRYERTGGEPKLSGGYGAKALLRETGGIIHPGDTAEGEFRAGAIVLATGGSSYPNSGTTGDGWPWARAAGHTVVKVRAALAPLYIDLEPRSGIATADLAGVALREIELKARGAGKTLIKWGGDLLFTHQGISGPTALGVSRLVAEAMDAGPVELLADLAPETPAEEIAAYWHGLAPSRTGVETALKELAPERIAAEIARLEGIEPGTTLGALGPKGRNRLADRVKALGLGRVRTVPLEKGEVVAGGVTLDEVDPHTMASRKCARLFLCGEVLDIAGPVGGYNLQAAFATGHVAGESAAKLALASESPRKAK